MSIILLAYTIHCESLETDQHGIDSYDLKKNYCGESLGLAIETVCVEYDRNPGISKY